MARDVLLLKIFTLGALNRTMCDILDQTLPDDDRSGLMAFEWVSETEMSFLTPCERNVPATDWPTISDSYRTVAVQTPNGNTSPLRHDVERGHLALAQQIQSLVYVTDKCVEPGTILLSGRCRPCPQGAFK